MKIDRRFDPREIMEMERMYASGEKVEYMAFILGRHRSSLTRKLKDLFEDGRLKRHRPGLRRAGP
jgi:predicted transcriptional regulator